MKYKWLRLALVGIGAIALAACGGEAPPDSESPATTAAPTEDAEPAETLASADAPGKLQFLQCASCHAVEANAAPKVGPNLNCVIGRSAGSFEGFKYSSAFQKAASDGLVWDRATMLSFLEKPMNVVPGNAMAFGGVSNADNREAIADYLEATCTSDA